MLCTLIGAIILSINIQVGLNMHLYDDIGDASSSLRGLTSSFPLYLCIHSLCMKLQYVSITHCSYHYCTNILVYSTVRHRIPHQFYELLITERMGHHIPFLYLVKFMIPCLYNSFGYFIGQICSAL